MSLGKIVAFELTEEAKSLRKMLERIPAEKLSWKPHEKSMTLESLAGHIVNMVGWTSVTLKQDELDFAKMDYQPPTYKDASELTADFDKNLAESLATLAATSDETMATDWTLRNGEHVLFTTSKAATLRSMVMNHIIHHRGQLAVYLRLLDVPLPSIYGPSADEPM